MSFVIRGLIVLLAMLLPSGSVAGATRNAVAFDQVIRNGDPPEYGFAANFHRAIQSRPTNNPQWILPSFPHFENGVLADLPSDGYALTFFYAPNAERIEDPVHRTAIILNCAKSLEYDLDLRAKTYRLRVASQLSSGANGTLPDLTATVSSDKAQSIGGMRVEPFAASLRLSYPRPLVGNVSVAPAITDFDFRFFFAAFEEPMMSCGSGLVDQLMVEHPAFIYILATAARQVRPDASFSLMRRRFCYFAILAQIADGKRTKSIVIERGNLRMVVSTKGIFDVPPDFKRLE